MFFNELDMLEGRLEYLYDQVDYFVIVESDRTHSGQPKPMNYLANLPRFRKYSDKIIYSPYSPDVDKYNDELFKETGVFSPAVAMNMDEDQRRHIGKSLKLFSPTDIIIISDLDEIPSKRALRLAIGQLKTNKLAVGLVQEMFYYNLKQRQIGDWVGTVVTMNKNFAARDLQWFRDNRWNLPRIEQAGWHLSYWGSFDKIQTKILNFAHQEWRDNEYTDIDKITERVLNGKDLFNRGGSYDFEPVDPATLDPELVNSFGKYQRNYIPHFYKNVEGWFSEEDIGFYKEMFDKFNGPAYFVEIGSYKGRSTSFMAVEIANSGKAIKFDCVDTWEGSPEHQAGGDIEDSDVVNGTMFDVFEQNMKPVKDFYTPYKMTSVEASKMYADNSLDFVFIDADHKYESVVEDILAWFPKVKNGGIISGHDFHISAPGVMLASKQILKGVRSIGDCWYATVKKT
jgi:beta-1,4-mannosyl-glycoprotein beta-1,4-N-acetylglucosaminyltransferase